MIPCSDVAVGVLDDCLTVVVDWNAHDVVSVRAMLITAMQLHTLIVTILLCFCTYNVVAVFRVSSAVPQHQ